MSADVRVAIENDEIVLAAIQDKIRRVVSRTFLGYTEDAVLFVGHLGSGGSDVCVPPGAPESIHSSEATLPARVVPFCRARGRRVLIDQLLELLAGFEIRNAFGGNVNRLASLRIAPATRAAAAHAKASKST